MTVRARGIDSRAGPSGVTGRDAYQPGSGRHNGAPRRPARPANRDSNSGRHRHRKRNNRTGGHRVVLGIWWIFANTVSARLGTVVIGLVLARMVSPREFGVFAVAVAALLTIQSFDQLGLRQALVTWPGEPDEAAPTTTTISVLFGAAICAGCWAAAPVFASALGAPAAAGVIRVLAPTVIIRALATAPAALVERRSPRALKVLVDQVDSWIGVITSIGLILTRHGLMSLAVGWLIASVVSTLLYCLFAPRALGLGFRLSIARKVLRAGLPLAGASILLFANTNADLIVIAHMLPTADLGYYLLALCLASAPVALFSQPVRNMAQAAFVRFRRGRLVVGSAFLSSANLLACLTLPVCILLIVSAGNLVRLFYGTEWGPASHVLTWLAPLAALRAFYELTHHYLAARFSLRAALLFQAVFLTALVPSLLAGVAAGGIVGAAFVQIFICVGFLTPLYLHGIERAAIQPRMLTARLVVWTATAFAVGSIVLGIRRNMVPDERLDLAAAASGTLVAVSILVYRMRTQVRALRGAAARIKPMPLMNVNAPTIVHEFTAPLYPVITLVPPLAPPRSHEQTRDEAADADSGELKSLGSKVRSGARWSILNTVVLRIANFATSVVLARTVFGPQEFGLYAVSQVVLAILLSVNELGVSLAVIRWDGDVRSFARTVATLSVASSTLIYGGLLAIAPEAARLLGSPHATGMIRLLGFCVVIDGFACVPLALLTRTFAQQRFMLVNSLNFIVSTAVTLWLAFSGKGAIGFAWGSVAGCTTMLVAAMITAPFFVLPGWNSSDARNLLRFGLPLAGASLLMLGVFNVDSAIVGAVLGPTALGLYQLAFNISSWPARSISEAAQRVSFAGFSRVANSADQLADAFSRALGLVMACAVPACVLLATLAGPLIHLVYGERWIAAAPVLTLLAILGLLRVAYELSYDCLAAAGKRPTLLAVQAWWLMVLIPVLFIGAHLRGIVGVGEGHILVAGPLVCPAFLWALSRCGIRISSIFAACAWPFLGGVLMIITCEFVQHSLGDSIADFAAATAAAMAVYLPTVFPMRKLLRRPAPEPTGLSEAQAA